MGWDLVPLNALSLMNIIRSGWDILSHKCYLLICFEKQGNEIVDKATANESIIQPVVQKISSVVQCAAVKHSM